MRSERGLGFDSEARAVSAPCPECRKPVALRREETVLHRLLRCPHCDGHLQVVGLSPVSLQVFKTHGLALLDD